MGAEAIIGGAGGALSGAAAGSAFGPVGTVVGGAIGLLGGLFGSKKAKAPAYQPLDISKIITDARTQAESNLKGSIALENQYRPGTAQLRMTTDSALQDLASGNTTGFRARDAMLGSLFGSGGGINDLLKESTDRILGQLRLGGALDPETQAAVMKGALEGAGTSGISGSGAARGLAARDLGMTSLGLMQQRQAAGLQAGSALQSAQLGVLNAAMGAAGQDLQRTGTLASIIDSRALPESGLSPGAVADLYVSDNNARNQVSANNAMIDATQRNANLQAMLGLGSTLVGSGGIKGLFGTAGGSNPSTKIAGSLF